MTGLLSVFLRMTGSAAVAAILVMVLRLMLRNTRTPKWMLCMLWMVVLFRMVCPISIRTGASAFNLQLFHNIDTAYENTASAYIREGRAAIEGSEEYEAALIDGVEPIDVTINGNNMGFSAVYYLTDDDGRMINTPTVIDKYGGLLFAIWLSVAALLFAYCVISWVVLKHKLQFAIRLEDRIYETDAIKTSLVLGFTAPKVYLASGMTEQEKELVLEHERTHIRRLDHILKPVFYLCCCLHWWNPICWFSYLLLCTDIELACDEAVIARFGEGAKAEYGEALIALSSKRNILLPTVPLSFGESAVKNRVKSVLQIRAASKPAMVLSTAICALCVFVSGTNATVGFAPQKAAYSSHMLVEYGIGVTESDVRHLTDIECFIFEPAPKLYYDSGFKNPVAGIMVSGDPGLGITTQWPVGGLYTFMSDLLEGDDFYIRAPLAKFTGKIDAVTAVFDAQGKSLAMINGEPWMELTMQTPGDNSALGHQLIVDVVLMQEGLIPEKSATLTLQDGRNIPISSMSFSGANDSYWFSEGEFKFNIAEMLVDAEGVYITFREASEFIIETAVPVIHQRGGR